MSGGLQPRWIVVTGGGLFLLLAAHAIWSVRKQYREQRRLSDPVVIEVWALYILHAMLVGFAAWQSVWPIPVEPTWAAVGGIALLALGLSILVISVWAFQSFRRMSGQRTDRLVTGGIYRWSRNPQNVGWLLALLGIALWGGPGERLCSRLCLRLSCTCTSRRWKRFTWNDYMATSMWSTRRRQHVIWTGPLIKNGTKRDN